jgi:DNA-binding NarL/FixJ family response regulator
MAVIRTVLIENMERVHRMYRRILERIEGIELIGSYYDPAELLAAMDSGLEPELIITDVRMDDEKTYADIKHADGIEAAQRIRMRFPRMPIIFYSNWEKPEYYRRIEEARFGTRYAFVMRHSFTDLERIGEIIRMVVRGQTYIDPEMLVEIDLLKERSSRSPMNLMQNDDQRKVLRFLGDGLSNDEIAHTMSHSTRWVEEQVKTIYSSLSLTNESGGDSRRIRAARMVLEDRLLLWQSQPDATIALLTEDRQGAWRPLDEVKHEEGLAKEDARVIGSM